MALLLCFNKAQEWTPAIDCCTQSTEGPYPGHPECDGDQWEGEWAGLWVMPHLPISSEKAANDPCPEDA